MKFSRNTAIVLAAAFGLSIAVAHGPPGFAQDNAQDSGQSLDDLLGIPDSPPPPDAPPEVGAPPDVPPDAPPQPNADPDAADPEPERPFDPDDLDPELARELTGAQAADVFARAVEDMGDVAVRLGRSYDPGLDTQREQQRIIDRLEVLARRIEQPSGDPSGEPQPGEARPPEPGGSPPAPGQQPGAQPGQAQAAGAANDPQGAQASPGTVQGTPPVALEDLRQGAWGNLPPRLRNQLAESFDEPFSSPYRRLTEQYYLRLAEALRQEADDAPQ
ncbi:MAG: hypothetical protein AAF288_12050 [Planctomycetota bacterium]